LVNLPLTQDCYDVEEGNVKMQTILFLCTGNSCRSQMAEAIVNHEHGPAWQAFSAGTLPAGFVHPLPWRF
jgi:hypothetical protein